MLCVCVCSPDLGSCIGCGLPGVSIPIMALFDYLGFRLMATALIPIGDNTLVCMLILMYLRICMETMLINAPMTVLIVCRWHG